MRRFVWLSLLLIGVVTAVACSIAGGQSVRSSAMPTPTPPPVPGSPDPPHFYRATTWLHNGVPASFVPNKQVQIVYWRGLGQMTVQTGCGSLSGDYAFDGSNLRLTNISRGRTMEDDAWCTDADKRQDELMASFFGSAPNYTMTDSELDITSGAMTLVFVPES